MDGNRTWILTNMTIHHQANHCYNAKHNDVEQFERLGVLYKWAKDNNCPFDELQEAIKQARANLSGKPEPVEGKPEITPEIAPEVEIKVDSRRAPPPMIDAKVSASGTKLRSKDPTRKSILGMADEKRKG